MFVYVIVCSETLKIYVGQHKGSDLLHYLQQKFSEALRGVGGKSRLYASMRKHPRDSWSIHPLVSDVQTREELDVLEKHFIRVLKTQHPVVGYNICRGGEGFTGPHSEETKQKMSRRMQIVMIGNNHGKGNKDISHPYAADHCRRLGAAMKGKPKSKLHAQHIGDGHRGLEYHYTPESRQRLATMTGKTHSDEWKQAAKLRMLGFQHSEEAKQKMRHPKSPETIQKMRLAQQARRRKERVR